MKLSLYSKSILCTEILIPFYKIGNNIETLLENEIKKKEGKCIKEGYLKPNSVSIMNYSSGMCISENVKFNVTYSCFVCCPVQGMEIRVHITSITKAGIRAKSKDESSPIDVFIARDYNISNPIYKSKAIGDDIKVIIIGYRFEVNDEKISIIADIADEQTQKIKIIDNLKESIEVI